MQRFSDVSTWSDVTNHIIFRRKVRHQIHRILKVIAFLLFLIFICFCFHEKEKFFLITKTIEKNIKVLSNQLFKNEIKEILIHLREDSLLDKKEVDEISKQLSKKAINRQEMRKIVDNIINNNSLIEGVYMRKNLSNGQLVVFLMEKKIIGVLYGNNCQSNPDECKKNIISAENQVLPYHRLNDDSKILKIYGKIGTTNVNKIYQVLQKNSLIDKISYIRFYPSGRFDMVLKNKLIIKLPRQNWLRSIQKFNKLDSEYMLSSEIRNVKYIDLRVNDRMFVGQ